MPVLSRVWQIYSNIQIFLIQIFIWIFVCIEILIQIYSDIRSCQKCSYEYIRIFVCVIFLTQIYSDIRSYQNPYECHTLVHIMSAHSAGWLTPIYLNRSSKSPFDWPPLFSIYSIITITIIGSIATCICNIQGFDTKMYLPL